MSQAISLMVADILRIQPSQQGHPHAKLTPSQASDIRHRYAKGKATQPQLAKEYGVHRKTIERLINGTTYSYRGH
jgi:DNA-binding MarR family transcriptional regulator